MPTGRNRRFAIILSGLPPHVDWPDLKDELRKVSSNPSWVRVTPDRNGIFGVIEAELDSVYEYLVLNSERIWPGYRLVAHVFDTTSGDRAIPVMANCHRETCACRHNTGNYSISSLEGGLVAQELSRTQLQQMHHVLPPGQGLQPHLPPPPPQAGFMSFPPSPATTEPSRSPMQSSGVFGGEATAITGRLPFHGASASPGLMFSQQLATPYDQYVYSGKGLPVNMTQGIYPTEARSVMVKRLPFTIQEAELRTLLAKAGRIVGNLDIHRDKQGRTRYARARFATPGEASAAVAMYNQKLFKGLVIDVSLARDRELTTGGQDIESEEAATKTEVTDERGKGKEHEGPLVVRG